MNEVDRLRLAGWNWSDIAKLKKQSITKTVNDCIDSIYKERYGNYQDYIGDGNRGKDSTN